MGVGVNDLTAVKVYSEAQKRFKHLELLATSAIASIDAGGYNVSQLRSGVVDPFIDAFNDMIDIDSWSSANKLELNDYVATATVLTDYVAEYVVTRVAARDVALQGLADMPEEAGGHVMELIYAADGSKTFNLVADTVALRAALVIYLSEAQNSG